MKHSTPSKVGMKNYLSVSSRITVEFPDSTFLEVEGYGPPDLELK